MVFAQAGELALHAFLELASEKVRDIGAEGLVWRAEESGAGTVPGKGSALHEIDEGRGIVGAGAEQFFRHASQGGSTADGGEALWIVSRLALEAVVPAGGTDERAKEDEAVGDAGNLGQELGELETVELGRDGSERATNLGGSVGLRVDKVHLGRPAVEVKVDDGLVGGTDAGGRLGPEQIGQGKAAQAEGADAKESAPVDRVVARESYHASTRLLFYFPKFNLSPQVAPTLELGG